MAKPRHQPSRTCVACRQEAGKADLVRVVRRPDGGVAVDRTGRASGRGAYLHADPACLETARKRRALDRALGTPVPPEIWSEIE
ncbi:MAG: YlxR family protein [Chloroflexi bacterium]|nr:MAG: YlxR family protein [Chloroflexota bacterium]